MNYEFENREKGSTRHKLEEAAYFLGQMKSTVEDDKVYSFNLSAFVTAARSVTLIMNVEFACVTEFKNWYDDKQGIIQSDDFDFFNKMRKATVHTYRVKPNKHVSIGIFEPVGITSAQTTSMRIVERFFKEYPEKRLDELCGKYLQNLTLLVDECEQLFNSSKAGSLQKI